MPADPRRAKDLFAAALDLPPADRAAFLDRECPPELRPRVDALLAAHDDPASALERPLVDSPTRSFAPDDATASHTPTETPGMIVAGRYKLLESIGEGGMGEVWVADQLEPIKRRVALKLIKPGMDSRSVLARFEAERQALALMDHPNIAKVLDAGTTEDGRPYFVMELVKGTPITQFCDARKLTPKERLELFVPVCQAIQHAHHKGIIHRDIKPSNVLVALHDEKPVPKVIDFGVAKAIGQQLTERTLYTGFGALVGTPAYMAPEQATFNQLDIDTRADVYALGVLLYELLAGSPPIEKERLKQAALDEVLRIVREEEPQRPSARLSTSQAKASIAATRQSDPAKLSSLMRGELDWIVMKALEKDRNRRYDTPTGLARDIQRYLADELVEARPPSVGYRLRKLVRRHKGHVVAAGVIAVAMIGGLIGAAYGVSEARNQKRANELRVQAEGDRDAAEKSRDELAKEREKLAIVEYGRAIQAAYQEWREDNVPAMVQILEGTRPDLRGWEWHLLNRFPQGDVMTIRGHTGQAFGVWATAFSPDGSQILTSGGNMAKVWDARTGRELLSLSGQPDVMHSASFSPDGSRILTPCEKTAKVWDAKSGEPLVTFQGHTDTVVDAVYSPDGSRVVTTCLDETAKVWDAKTGKELFTLKAHKKEQTGVVFRVRWSPDGSRIVTPGMMDGIVRVWDASTGKELVAFKAESYVVYSAEFSPDGARIVTTGFGHVVKVWDAKTGQLLIPLKGHRNSVTCASYSRDGTRILTASADATVRVWDATTGTELMLLKGHTAGISSASFSPDGTRIVTGSGDKTAKVWEVKPTTGTLTLKGHEGMLIAASYSPDGTLVVTGGLDKIARVWNSRTGAEFHALKGHANHIHSASFSPDGTQLVSGDEDGVIKMWDVKRGAELRSWKGHTKDVRTAHFSPDGARIVTASDDGSVKLWDAKTGVETLRYAARADIALFARSSPDGSRLVTAGGDNMARVLDAGTGAERLALKGHSRVVAHAAFSPDGSKIVTGSFDKSVRVWDANTGVELMVLNGHTKVVFAVAFSPDGSRIVSSGWDQTAKIWDAKTGTELLTLKDHTDCVITASFSPDGTKLLTGSYDSTAKIWDAAPTPREGK